MLLLAKYKNVQNSSQISLGSEDRRNISEMNNPFSIKQLQEKYPYMNWHAFINSILPSGMSVGEDESVVVTATTFFTALGDLLQRTPKRTVANYLIWRISLFAAKFMTAEQRAGRIKFLAAITGQQVDMPRWKECIEFTSAR